VNARNGETATVTSASFTNNATSGLSTSTGNNTTTGTSVTVFAGEAGAITETMTNAANYNAVLACTGNATALSGATLTVAPADTAITCTFTNTRRSTTLTLRKTWAANSIANNAISIPVTTGLINNTAILTSTALAAGNTTTGTAVTVFAGETANFGAESFTTGTAANYNSTLACSAGTFAGSGNGQAAGNSLVITAASTSGAITCTYTNTRRSAQLTLAKTWSGTANAAHNATVTSAGFINAATSGASTNGGGNTTTGTSVTVYAGESGTISEAGTGLASYVQALACAGNGTALAGATLTIAPADTAITCTFTNTLAVPSIAVTKTPSVGNVTTAGTVVTYTVRVTNTGNVPATAISVTDPLGTLTCPTSGTNTIASLAPLAFEDCTMSYTVTQAVIDANGGGDGDIDNTASASGTTGFGPVNGSVSAIVTISGGATLSILKEAIFPPGAGGDVNGNGTADVGEVITYRYTVTNNGNRTVTGVGVSDVHNGYNTDPVPGSEVIFTDVAPLLDSSDGGANSSWDSLAPGDSVRFTATYNVNQDDIDLLQ
jgi:uncharacterized repeat protein (TIGR01451 family)